MSTMLKLTRAQLLEEMKKLDAAIKAGADPNAVAAAAQHLDPQPLYDGPHAGAGARTVVKRFGERDLDTMAWERQRDSVKKLGAKALTDRRFTVKALAALVTSDARDPGIDELGDANSTKALMDLQDVHDGVMLAALCEKSVGRGSPHLARYNRLAGQLLGKVYGIDAGEAMKALTTGGSATGAEYIPNLMSGALVPYIRQNLQLANLIPTMTMPSNPWLLPVEGADVYPYLTAEMNSDDVTGTGTATAYYGARTPATSKLTISAKKFGARIYISSESDEDSIVSTVGLARGKMGKALAYGIEGGVVNGDTAGTHQDNDTTASTDYRKAWDGLRKLVTTSGGTNSTAYATRTAGSNKLVSADIATLLQKFGKFAQDRSRLVFVVNMAGYVHLLADTNFNRFDAHGGVPPLVSGQVGDVFGVPVIISSAIRDDLDTNGVNSATPANNVYTMGLLVALDAFSLFDRRMVSVQSIFDAMSDRYAVIGSWRGTFARILAEEDVAGLPLARNVGRVIAVSRNATF